MVKTDKSALEMDALLVDDIGRGDALAWEEFVRRHTGWVLYTSGKWCEKHCPHRFAAMDCGIKSISIRVAAEGGNAKGRTWALNQRSRADGAQECDEGMDTYIWIMEQLKKRIMRYTGKNAGRLSTFVWRVLNSRELYIDWLRWKFGRVF
jgi:hypothetical protein